MFSMQRCFKTNQWLVRGTSNLLVERRNKEEIPNKSVSEILGSLPLKTFSSMLRMLLKKIDLSSEKIGQ